MSKNKKLKDIPADKKKSLGKLPEKVRNNMGYAKKGKMMKASKGAMIGGAHKAYKQTGKI